MGPKRLTGKTEVFSRKPRLPMWVCLHFHRIGLDRFHSLNRHQMANTALEKVCQETPWSLPHLADERSTLYADGSRGKGER